MTKVLHDKSAENVEAEFTKLLKTFNFIEEELKELSDGELALINNLRDAHIKFAKDLKELIASGKIEENDMVLDDWFDMGATKEAEEAYGELLDKLK
jgi:hypothetical protein